MTPSLSTRVVAGVPAATFVEVWNGCESLAEVSEVLQAPMRTLKVRASELRSEGVSLKKFKVGRKSKKEVL